MGHILCEGITDTWTESYHNSPIARSVVDCRINSVTLYYRDGHTSTQIFPNKWYGGSAVSPDGSRFYFINTDQYLCCHDIHTFHCIWKYPQAGNSTIFPADRGVILMETPSHIEYARQTDENGWDVFDKIQVSENYLTLLDAETGQIIVRQKYTEYPSPTELTHDHLLIRCSADTGRILRKSDLSTVCDLPAKEWPYSYLYIIGGKLYHYRTVRAYGSLYNYEETQMDAELPGEVLRSAETYAWECEEQRHILMEENPPYDFLDPRLHGIVDAEGNITDIKKFEEYTGLYMIPFRSENIASHCFLCGTAVTEGYSTIDVRKVVCEDCYRTFHRILCLITAFGLKNAENGESFRYDERLRDSRNRYDHSTGTFDEFQALSAAGGYVRVTREMNDGTTDEWFMHAAAGSMFPDWVNSFRNGLGNTVRRIEIAVLSEDSESNHCLVLNITHDTAQYTAYPPIISAENEAEEVFRTVLPGYRDAGLENNPFASFCTEYTINTLWSMTKEFDESQPALELFDRFAKAAYAQGARTIYFLSSSPDNDFYISETDSGSTRHAYRINLTPDGADINANLRAYIGCTRTSIVIAENLGAVIFSRFGYAVTGGTPELMKNLRRPLEIYDFMNDYYIFYWPSNREFYKRKRALVTWSTTSEQYPDGQYDLLHAHRFSSGNRKYLEDNTVCGCFCCGRFFRGRDITEWLDNNETARCPFCGTDSILPENCGHPVTKEFLEQMKKLWFGGM